MKYIDYRLWKEGKLRRKIPYTDGSSRMGTFFTHEYIELLEIGVRKIYYDVKTGITWCDMGRFRKRRKLYLMLLEIRNRIGFRNEIKKCLYIADKSRMVRNKNSANETKK